jgi:hypothetical protein
MLAAYGSGLLNYHVFCDLKSIPEEERAPVNLTLISAFIASIAGAYSGSTIDNYVYGIRAWHILHGVRWQMETAELEAILWAAEKVTPHTSKKKKRVPYTPDFILTVRGQLELDKLQDVAVYGCLTTTFYAAGHLGEFTVPNLGAFDKDRHIKPSDIRIEHNHNGLHSMVFYIPKTKTSNQGEDVSWSKQSGDTDPQAALAHHMAINNPPWNGHLLRTSTRMENTALSQSLSSSGLWWLQQGRPVSTCIKDMASALGLPLNTYRGARRSR